MTITKMVIGFILMITVVIGLGEYYTSNTDIYSPANYASENTSFTSSAANFTQFNSSFDKINTLMNQTVEHALGVEFSLSGLADTVLLMFDVGGILAQLPGLMLSAVSQMYGLLPMIPWWAKAMITILIIAVVALRLASAFMRTEEI